MYHTVHYDLHKMSRSKLALPYLHNSTYLDISIPPQVCDSLASSSILEDGGNTRSSGESIGVFCPHPLAVTVIFFLRADALFCLS